MPLPTLTLGLVVRYEYNWARRADRFDNADKDHPACIVATYRKQGTAEDLVLYLPISHTPPTGDDEGIELPEAVKKAAGLDSRRQWVLVSECNLDRWPTDIRALPRQPGRFHYGHLPPKFFDVIKARFAELFRERKSHVVPRSPP